MKCMISELRLYFEVQLGVRINNKLFFDHCTRYLVIKMQMYLKSFSQFIELPIYNKNEKFRHLPLIN